MRRQQWLEGVRLNVPERPKPRFKPIVRREKFGYSVCRGFGGYSPNPPRGKDNYRSCF